MDQERKRALKQRVRDEERKAFLSAMPMTLAQANSLLDVLDEKLGAEPCDHSHRRTSEWCQLQGLNCEAVLNWARKTGGYCDCEVLANLADPVEDAAKFQE